jgi:predicted DNA-binding transcriptional regulator AlpA
MKIPQPGSLMRRADAASFLALSVPTLRRREHDDPSFPKPVVISDRAVGYRTTEILQWAASRPVAVANSAATAAATAALAAKRASERRHP